MFWTFSNNTVNDNGRDGFAVESLGKIVSDVAIVGNSFDNNGRDGVFLNYSGHAHSVDPSEAVIVGNTIVDSGDNGIDFRVLGLGSLHEPADVGALFEGNTILGSGSSALRVDRDTFSRDLVLVGNQPNVTSGSGDGRAVNEIWLGVSPGTAFSINGITYTDSTGDLAE